MEKRVIYHLYKIQTAAFSWYNLCIKKMKTIILVAVLKVVLTVR